MERWCARNLLYSQVQFILQVKLALTDPGGFDTLSTFAGATNFNRWLFESIESYCKGTILEIGSGIGNISELLLQGGLPIALSDLRPEYCEILKNRFNNWGNLIGIFQIDLSLSNFEDVHHELLGRFDTVVALNVIEHIQDDILAVRNCRKLLKRDGRLIVLVPAFQSLYNNLDAELGHFVRYKKVSLLRLLDDAEMKTIELKYFNSPAILGWWLNGSILKRKQMSTSQIKVYDTVVPFLRIIDKLISKKIGISLIVVSEKVS